MRRYAVLPTKAVMYNVLPEPAGRLSQQLYCWWLQAEPLNSLNYTKPTVSIATTPLQLGYVKLQARRKKKVDVLPSRLQLSLQSFPSSASPQQSSPTPMAPLRCANASSSAAWLFLRLASLRHSAVSAATASKARPSSAPPEFLLPLGLSTRAAPAPRRACRPDSLVSRASLVASSVVSEPSVRRRRRFFSTSPAKYATACVRNPVIDDQGNEMMLEITPRAAMVRRTTCLPHHSPELGEFADQKLRH